MTSLAHADTSPSYMVMHIAYDCTETDDSTVRCSGIVNSPDEDISIKSSHYKKKDEITKGAMLLPDNTSSSHHSDSKRLPHVRVQGIPCTKYEFIQSEQAFYKVHKRAKSWYDARTTCTLEGATLLYPETEAESALTVKLLDDVGVNNNSYVWVGAHDIFSEDIFVKMNGEELCYAPWRSGEPNNAGGNEDCVVQQKGQLIDVSCTRLHIFICKKLLSSATINSVCQTLDPAYVPNADNSSCYKLHVQPKTWPEAYAICKAEEAYLAIINSHSEAEFLVQLIKNVHDEQIKVPYHKGHISIGFHDLFKEGEYLTIQGETLDQANYKEWQGGQPDDYKGKEDCGSITKDAKLNDINCEAIIYVVILLRVYWRKVTRARRTASADWWITPGTTGMRPRDLFTTSRDYRESVGPKELRSYLVSHNTTRLFQAVGSEDESPRTNIEKYPIASVQVRDHLQLCEADKCGPRLALGNMELVGTASWRSSSSEQAVYKVHKQVKSWYGAQTTCAREGATLFYPETTDETTVMLKLLEDAGVNNSHFSWVGAHDIFSEGTFVNLNDEKLCYAPWVSGEPNNYKNEDCVAQQRGLICDLWCSRLYSFICKKLLPSRYNSVCRTHDLAYVPNSDNSSCYKIHIQPKTWPQAYATCKAEESRLAIVNSHHEADFLVQLMNNIPHEQIRVPYYNGHLSIGFHDLFEEGEYLTIQGETLEQANYNEWQGGQPNDAGGNEDCGSISRDGKLNDINCETVTLFICERNITSDANEVDMFSRCQMPTLSNKVY
ncbi:Hemolymph lipopolysaccharide-binding protein [Eumeta japonica]|uniref:Hemolymph lipopolysaccharide-binding protein n=1 Tax=Eumeta variegata TaxID=151549 RepID=A0A4C1WZV4_EUMVA|nr:Hemolymph lipopolysaccharide-binding protein [Eumeta japonica]